MLQDAHGDQLRLISDSSRAARNDQGFEIRYLLRQIDVQRAVQLLDGILLTQKTRAGINCGHLAAADQDGRALVGR